MEKIIILASPKKFARFFRHISAHPQYTISQNRNFGCFIDGHPCIMKNIKYFHAENLLKIELSDFNGETNITANLVIQDGIVIDLTR